MRLNSFGISKNQEKEAMPELSYYSKNPEK